MGVLGVRAGLKERSRSYIRTVRFSELPLHPFLFTLYPVFFLYSKNLDELQTAFVLVRPLIVLLSTTTLILALSYLYFRKLDVAAVTASLFSLPSLTLMGGIVKLLMDGLHIGLNINAILIYFAAYGVLLLGPIYVLVRAARIPSWAGLYLNVLACALLIVPLTMLLPGAQRVAPVPPSDEIPLPNTDAIREHSPLPDVYFIILDGYARADTLREFFQFDNSPFLDAMKAHGFFVAERSASRYPRTIESVAAMVSMD